MTTRADLVHWALAQNGKFDGVGYPGHNSYSPDLGRPQEFWCGDFVTDAFKQAGDPLKSMQPGCKTGFAYCPDAVDWARANGAAKRSWQALPGDIALFDWNGDGVSDHTELVIAWSAGVLHTIGGDSGPSNVDGFKGQGGVHRHDWPAPMNYGNAQVMLVVDAAKAALHGFAAAPTPPKPAPPISGELLMLKTPMMHDAEVGRVQTALQHHSFYRGYQVDDIYGKHTRDAVIAFQVHTWPNRPKFWDGIVGPDTHRALGA